MNLAAAAAAAAAAEVRERKSTTSLPDDEMREDNARLLLLLSVLCVYLTFGAFVFSLLELDDEEERRAAYYVRLKAFLDRNPTVEAADLDRLLAGHASAAAAGLLRGWRPRWDYAGALHFVSTSISTIGKSNPVNFLLYVLYVYCKSE